MRLSLSFFGDYPATVGPPAYETVRRAVTAADGHLSAVWLPERHFHGFGGLSPNPAVLGAFVAAVTTSLRIRAGSVVLPLHDPIRVAEEWAMVDAMSGGRVDVAFASGWQRTDFVLARTDFADRRAVMWSGIDTVTRLWRGEPVRAAGHDVDAEVRLHPRPVSPRLPVWIAALGSPETFARAGEQGHAVLTNLVGQTQEQLAANIARYRSARAAAGHPGPGTVTALLHTLVAADPDGVHAARLPLRRYFGSSVDLLTAAVGSDRRAAYDRLGDADRDYLLDRAVDRYLEHNAMIGDSAFCADAARRIAGCGVDEIACFVDFGIPAADLLTGVDRLVALQRHLDRSEPAPAPAVAVRGRSRAAADVPAGTGPDDVLAAVAAAPASATLLRRSGPPPVHVVDLGLLDDAEQEEQASEFYELEDDTVDPWALTLVGRGTGRSRLIASVDGASAQDVLDGLVAVLDGAPAARDHVTADHVTADHVTADPAPDTAARDAGVPDDGVPVATPASETAPGTGAPIVAPATPNERLLLLACEADPDIAAAHQVRTTLRLDGDCDVDALQHAVDLVAARHQALRTTWGDDGETLTVHRDLSPAVHVMDLSALDGPQVALELVEWYATDAAAPIDLADGPPWRVTVVREAERRHRLVVSVHHIVYDGWSERILLSDLASAYTAAVRVGAPDWPPAVNYLAWRAADAATPPSAADREHWRALSADVEAAAARGELAGGPGARLRRVLPAETVAALRRAGARTRCTPYVTLLSCFATLLGRLTGDDTVTVGVSVDRRDEAARAGLVGYFSNLLPLRVPVAPADPVGVAHAARAALLDARDHQRLPFAEIVAAAARGDRSGPTAPLVSACFNWDHVTAFDLGGVRAPVEPDEAAFVRFALALNVVDPGDGTLALEWDHSLHAHDHEAAVKIADLYDDVVADLVDRDAGRDHAGTAAEDTLATRFAAAAARHPERIAVRDRFEAVGFATLRDRTTGLAGVLAGHGVRPGTVVTVVGPHAVPTVTAVLAVLVAGGAYTVLPPSTPDARVARHVAACGSSLVVWTTRTGSVDVVSATLDELAAQVGASTAAAPDPAGRTDPAYVIMTSGSTGAEKPVTVDHAAITDYVDALTERIPTAGRTCLSVTSMAHDLGYTAVWPALTTGGTVLLADEEVAADPALLADLCERTPADLLKITPTHLGAVLDADGEAVLPLRDLVLGGEVLRWSLVDRVRALNPNLTVWNHYGPTEATVGTTMYRVTDPDPARDRDTVPIGTPLGNRVRLAADPGELLVAGRLATGYQGLLEATAAAFPWVDDPDGGRTRWYRTGDVVTRLPGGALEFVGRVDDQVSVRGYRVEPGAVDAALTALPGVRAAASWAQGSGPDVRLVAAVVLDGDRVPRDVLAALAQTVPGHLVPSTLVPLAALPRTASGKVDRAALAASVPVPPAASTDGAPLPEPPPTTDDDRLAEMVAIWQGVLEVDRVAPDDDFFELGGHSIHAIKIVARVRSVFDHRVPIKTLFTSATPRRLLAVVAAPVLATEGDR